MKIFLKIAGIAATLLLLAGIGTTVYRAVRSPIFMLRVVELTDLPEGAPVTAAELEALVGIPLGSVSLFAVDLREIEAKLGKHPWVRAVHLQKRFPQTLAVSVQLRVPVALLNSTGGNLSYVDREGVVYGNFTPKYFPDLPQLHGIAANDREGLVGGLKLLDMWEASTFGSKFALSTVTWDHERGFRGVVSYPMALGSGDEFSGVSSSTARGLAIMLLGRSRVVVEFGPNVSSEDTQAQFHRIAGVLDYLGKNSLRARHVWADSGKKIIVKMLPNS